MPQTTKEQVMEKFDEQFPVNEFTGWQKTTRENFKDFLSSTYDTAYEKGVRDAMGKIEKIKPFYYVQSPKLGEIETWRKEDVHFALSELLKK